MRKLEGFVVACSEEKYTALGKRMQSELDLSWKNFNVCTIIIPKKDYDFTVIMDAPEEGTFSVGELWGKVMVCGVIISSIAGYAGRVIMSVGLRQRHM